MRTSFRSLLALALSLSLLGSAAAIAGPGSRPGQPQQARKQSRSLPPFTPARADALTKGLRRGTLNPAQYALERARSVFELKKVRGEFGDVERADPHLTTLVLRDLALRIGELQGAERKMAKRVLARPDGGDPGPLDISYQTESQVECAAAPVMLCYHWVESTRDATSPEQVAAVKATFDTVWQSEIVSQGYRAPKSDARSTNAGPNGNLDIYLADIGALGIYGYCTSDDPDLARLGSSQYPYYDFSGYCVLDNDYSSGEFPTGTPLSNLKVTAAHEFFHTVQFAYDGFEDGWLLEGTASAVEDHVFNDINDNYQYLFSSQLTRPDLSLDYSATSFSDPDSGSMYGSWLFWRFMSEALSDGTSVVDVDVIKEVWERADASKNMVYGDKYSLQAAAGVAAARGTKFRSLYRSFAVANAFPEDSYSEGTGYASFAGRPTFEPVVLDGTKLRSGALSKELDHLTASYTSFTPGNGVSEDALLKLNLNLPDKKRGSAAVALVRSVDGTVRPLNLPFPLNREGDGVMTIDFGSGAIAEVILVLVNASKRIKDCYQAATTASCSGVAKDDDQRFTYKGIVLQ